jgi:hypothetical protein
VHEHRELPTKRDDILSRLYDIHRANPERLGFRDVVGAVGINMYMVFSKLTQTADVGDRFAGHDALAISMRSILYYLCRNPRAYEKVRREIRQADRDGKLSPAISYVEAIGLPYL